MTRAQSPTRPGSPCYDLVHLNLLCTRPSLWPGWSWSTFLTCSSSVAERLQVSISLRESTGTLKTCPTTTLASLSTACRILLAERRLSPVKHSVYELLLIAVRRRCYSGRGSECAGEGAVIVEAGSLGDFCDGLVGLAQEARRRRNAGLGDELSRSEAEEAFGQTRQSLRRKLGSLSKPSRVLATRQY